VGPTDQRRKSMGNKALFSLEGRALPVRAAFCSDAFVIP